MSQRAATTVLGLKQDLVFKVAKRWIAGKYLNGAIEAAKVVNSKGIGAVINYLGEDVTDLSVAGRHAAEYLKLQHAISEDAIDGCVSVKLTQFGLSVSESFAHEKTELLAQEAEKLNQLFWLDMEGSKFTEKTLEFYYALLRKHGNVGIAIQAYLKRSENDLLELVSKGARVRLVKGAYRESPSLVFASREEIRENYSKLMGTLFERGSNFVVATHDSILIERAKTLSQTHSAKFEFAMLKGIRDKLKEELIASGYRVIDYIPYGEEWYGYSMRRMREHPSNVWLLLRSLI